MSNIGPREEVKGIKEMTLDELKERFELYKEKLKIAKQNFEFGTADELTDELKKLKQEYKRRVDMKAV